MCQEVTCPLPLRNLYALASISMHSFAHIMQDQLLLMRIMITTITVTGHGIYITSTALEQKVHYGNVHITRR